MARVRDNGFITFNDGTLDIYEAADRKLIRKKQEGIRYGRQTVGAVRFWKAKVASSTIDAVVAVPSATDVSAMDVAVIRGQQYLIRQAQDKFDQCPYREVQS